MSAGLRIAVTLSARLAESVLAVATPGDVVRRGPEIDWPCDVWITGAPLDERPAGGARVLVVTSVADAARASRGAVTDAVMLEDDVAGAIASWLDEIRRNRNDPFDDLLRSQARMVAEARAVLERESAKADALPPRWTPRPGAPLEVSDLPAFLAVVRHVEREARAHWRRFSVARMDGSLSDEVLAELRPVDVILRAPGGDAVLLPDVSRDDELALENAGASLARFPDTGGSAIDWLAFRLNLRRDPPAAT